MARSGDYCPGCKTGRLRTVRTITEGFSRLRYLRCRECGATSKETLTVDDLGRPLYGDGLISIPRNFASTTREDDQ